ncbi:MAG: protease SohB [Legionellales bacterium]|nr:protease SohB [Legionellales bacterium]OUX64275.1 MAG: protease SohB [Gammaproteobacteria bacterium TMED281]|tara:strand:+ start:2139 stop:3056 length:918 start_codon:yes stop_codon:yes gene_type:complete
MEEVFYEFLEYLLETMTLLVAILILLAALKKKSPTQINITHLNKKWFNINRLFLKSTLQKKKNKQKKPSDKRCYYLKFKGDLSASNVSKLRNEISAIINIAKAKDKVCINLESPGGTIIDYGLANSQLQRLKYAGIELDVVVDRVAASGGYLMACVADRIIAAPYAFIGSIGVAFELFNAHELLKKNHIQTEVITSKKYKRTLTPYSKTTAEAKAKVREDIAVYQKQFESSILKYRPKLNIQKVATGECWCAENAIHLGLVDELGTSDDYLFDTMKNFEVFEVEYFVKQNFKQKLFGKVRSYVGI